MGAYSDKSKDKTELIISELDEKSVYVSAFQTAFIELPANKEEMVYNSSNSIVLPATGDKVVTTVATLNPTANSFSVTAMAQAQTASATKEGDSEGGWWSGFWSGIWDGITGFWDSLVEGIWNAVGSVIKAIVTAALSGIAAFLGVKLGMLLMDAFGDSINFNLRDAIAKISQFDVNKLSAEFFTKALPDAFKFLDEKTDGKLKEFADKTKLSSVADTLGKVGGAAIKVYKFDIINGSLQVGLMGRTATKHKRERDKRMRNIVGGDYQNKQISVSLGAPVRKDGTALDKYRDVVVKIMDVASFDIFSSFDSLAQKVTGRIVGGGDFKNFAEVVRDIEANKSATQKANETFSQRIGSREKAHQEISAGVKTMSDILEPKGSGEGGAAGGAAGGIGNTTGSAGVPMDMNIIAKALYIKSNNSSEEFKKILTAKDNGDYYKSPAELGENVQGADKDWKQKDLEEKAESMSTFQKISLIEKTLDEYIVKGKEDSVENPLFNQVLGNEFSPKNFEDIKEAYLDGAFGHEAKEKDQIEEAKEVVEDTPSADQVEKDMDPMDDPDKDDLSLDKELDNAEILEEVNDRFKFEDSDGEIYTIDEFIEYLEETGVSVEDLLESGGHFLDLENGGKGDPIASVEDLSNWDFANLLDVLEEYFDDPVPIETPDLGGEANAMPDKLDMSDLGTVVEYSSIEEFIMDEVANRMQEQYQDSFENNDKTSNPVADFIDEMASLMMVGIEMLHQDISIAMAEFQIGSDDLEEAVEDKGPVETDDKDPKNEGQNDEDEERKHGHDKSK